ncbi:MAG: hypothetical protein CM15mP42_00020 [Methanobacteriota archaeon]|nr:MAG: hypothetical protein CM15mP42_00020 [Euryarchaeota archaeon]
MITNGRLFRNYQFNDGKILGNFVLYDERAFPVAKTDPKECSCPMLRDCYDYDRDGEYNYCYGSSPLCTCKRTLILQIQNRDWLVQYHLLTISTSRNVLITWKPCMGAMMGIELTPGDYTLVTTFNGYYEVLFRIWSKLQMVQLYQNGMVKFTMLTMYRKWDRTLVEGNDRIYMPYPEYEV